MEGTLDLSFKCNYELYLTIINSPHAGHRADAAEELLRRNAVKVEEAESQRLLKILENRKGRSATPSFVGNYEVTS